jgi:hypothetical protein
MDEMADQEDAELRQASPEAEDASGATPPGAPGAPGPAWRPGAAEGVARPATTAWHGGPQVQWLVTDTLDALRLRRHVEYQGRVLNARSRGGGSLAGESRGIGGMKPQSRANMRWRFASMPWEQLGLRASMVTLTYPGNWQEWVPDGETLERHRKAFAERWRRRFGTLTGVWVKEFQEAGRPHVHMYLAIPDAVAAEDFEALRLRTVGLQRLEARYGKYHGRRMMAPIGGAHGGAFGDWLLAAWSEVVGTAGTGEKHEKRGVDVKVCFWSEGAAEKDRMEVARYFANESGKLAQKEPPEGFGPVHRYWGTWGKKEGFSSIERTAEVSVDLGAELERRLVFLVRWRLRRQARWRDTEGRVGNFDQRRWGNGVTLFAIRPEDQARLYNWAETAARRNPGSASRRRSAAQAAENFRRHVEASFCDDCPGGCETPCSVEEGRRAV